MIVVFIFSALSLFSELRDLSGNYDLIDALIFVLLKVPSYFVEIFPICIFIGSLLALGNLSINNEIIAMQSNRYSLKNIFRSCLLVGLIFIMIISLIGFNFAPRLDVFARDYRANALTNISNSEAGAIWFSNAESIYRFIPSLDGNTIDRAMIFDRPDNYDETSLRFYNQLAPIEENWNFQSSSEIIYRSDQSLLSEYSNGNVSFPGISSIVESLYIREDLLEIGELYEYMDIYSQNGMNASRYAYAFWYKLGFFFSSMVMVVSALPFALGSMRTITMGARLTLGLSLGLSYFILNRLLLNFGQLFNQEPFLMMFMPHIIVLILIYLYLRQFFDLTSNTKSFE